MSCYFSFDFPEEKPGVQPELERSQSVLGPERSDTKIKNAFEGKYKVRVFTKSVRCQVGFEYGSRI